MDTPLEYFSSGNLIQSLGKAIEERHHLYTSFLVQGRFFPPPTKTKRVLTPLVLSSLKGFGRPPILIKIVCLDNE